MTIAEAIERMKAECGTSWHGIPIAEEHTRDQVLFGSTDALCTGIAVCIYPSVEVIRRAAALGCNLIVSHEALFWNHGDHTDWLAGNTTFEHKRALLEEAGTCVWRNHDHIHAGLMIDGARRDGIFYGMASELGWTSYIEEGEGEAADRFPCRFSIPTTNARELVNTLITRFGIHGVRALGNLEAPVTRVIVPMHIQGNQNHDRALIQTMDHDNINMVLAMELVDFTVAEYVRDAAQLGEPRCLVQIGHFNLEELGMRWYARHLKETFPDAPVYMVAAGDGYTYIGA